MKKFILAAFVVAFSFSASAQIVKNADGNFVETAAKKKPYKSKKQVAVLTGQTFTNAKGIQYKVWKSASGKYFVNVCPSSGRWYKKYLTVN